MKPILDITVCCTILDKVLTSLLLSTEDEQRLQRILQSHRIILSNEFVSLCEDYFKKKNNSSQLDSFQLFIANIVGSQQSVKMVPDFNGILDPKNKYNNELLGICSESKDKILLSNKEKLKNTISRQKLDISFYTESDSLNEQFSNILFRYTLPITHLMLPNTLSNQTVADWLGRFLRDETFIQIYDNFLLTPNEINAFNKYILPFIQKGASIHIYTAAENNITEEYIQQEFLKPKYASWKFCVYVMKVKNDLHERAIQTNNIIIHLDKGLALFGEKGHIPTSPISITANIESSRIRISDKQCRQLIGGN